MGRSTASSATATDSGSTSASMDDAATPLLLRRRHPVRGIEPAGDVVRAMARSAAQVLARLQANQGPTD